MDRDIASNATCEGIASAHATASTRATGRGRGMVGQWLQSLLVVWLLLGVSAPAWAADIVLSPGLASTNVGTPYAGSITASGGIAPYSYTVTAGALPAGLVLDAGTGAITGTATAGGIFDFTVTATDSSTGSGPYSGSLAYELVVYSPSMEVGPAGLPDGVVDEPYSVTLVTSGGTAPYSYQLTDGALPPGLSLPPGGLLSGTPTATGTFDFVIYSIDSSTGNGPYAMPRAYSLTVALAGPAAPIAGAVSATVAHGSGANPITLDLAGGAADTVAVATLPAHGTAIANGTAISYQPDPGYAGPDSFSYTATNASGTSAPATVTITVSPPTLALSPAAGALAFDYAVAHSQAFSTSGGAAPYTYALAGVLPAGLAFDTAAGTLSGMPSQIGSFPVTVTATDSSTGAAAPFSVTANYQVVVGPPVIAISPATLADGTAGSAYSQTLAASGGIGPYAFALTGGNLPAGMSLAADGNLSGTPTEAGAFPFAVTATDSSTGSGPYSGTGNYTLTIADVAPTANDVAATVAYGSDPTPITLDISGSVATSVVVASAPAHGVATANGLSIDYEPEAGYAGSDSFTYLARNAAGDSAPATVSITVDPPTLALTPAAGTLVPGYGEAYSQAFSASGGAAPYTYALTGPLPAGLTFDAGSGTLSGTAAESGSFPVTVTATDSSNGTAAPFSVTANYDVQIASATIAITPATLADGTAGDVYSQTLAASGGVAPYTFELASGTLPAGLQLAADGTLSGTPTASGTFAITLRATDAHGQAGDAGYTLVIAEAPPMAVDDAASTLAGQAVTIDVTGNDRGVIDAITVDAAPDHGSARIEGTGVVYTPVAGFFGTDSFRYVASGPGGSSAAATVTVEVAPLPVPSGQPQSLTTLAGETVQFDAATDATGGPFTGVAIVEAPAEGELAVDGTRIDYTPLATADGTVEVRYTLANAFDASEPITATITINPRPIAAAHQANTVSGGEVSVELTDAARGGPFTGAELLSVSPVEAGSASITATGVGDAAGYRLDFSAAADYAGSATVRYTLSNAHATSAAATVSLEIAARADPSRDPEVTGLLRAQVASVRRLARGQMGNFQQRMEQLHGGRAASAGFDNGLSVAIRRQCAEGDWQNPGSTCPRPLHDEGAPVVEPVAGLRAGSDAASPAPVPALGVWVAGAMSFGDYDSRRGASGFEFETQGISLGVDRRFGTAFAFGAGLGYGRDVTDVGEHQSRSEADAWSTVLYASYHPGEHAYLDALLGYQWLSLDLRRHVTANGGQVQGVRDGRQWLASVTGGYQWQRERFGITTYARVDAARAQLDGYVEQGDPVQALAFQAQDIDTTTTSLGLRADYRSEFEWGSFSPQLRLEYQHDLDDDSVATMRYADLLGGPFYRADIDGFDRNRFVLGLGAGWLTERQLGVRLEYRSVLGNSGADEQSVMLQVEKQY